MAKLIRNYKKWIDELLKRELTKEEWKKLREEHLTQIGFFQHERLIHLLVTLAFAVIAILTLFQCLTADSEPLMGVLFVALMSLLIPYIRHYFLLENEVQYMYEQYDTMVRKEQECIVGTKVWNPEKEKGKEVDQTGKENAGKEKNVNRQR